jgi:hypothetical protein
MLIVAGGEISEGGLNGPDGFFFTDPEPIPEPRKMVSTIIPRYLAYD